ncbi:hypothetical protein TNCV_3638351 [Trichonephila clavipes]|nr:hypothetical protein TNCV_3638351 [Trichonephila clavipes]
MFHDIASRIARNLTIVVRMWDCWVLKSHTLRRVRSQRTPERKDVLSDRLYNIVPTHHGPYVRNTAAQRLERTRGQWYSQQKAGYEIGSLPSFFLDESHFYVQQHERHFERR